MLLLAHSWVFVLEDGIIRHGIKEVLLHLKGTTKLVTQFPRVGSLETEEKLILLIEPGY